MNDIFSVSNKATEQLPLSTYTEKAYLDYAMYVILDRALPHIGDGLKPVQRRIIYAMSELGLLASAKYKKSARTVGDVLGKFHPHGDTACYEAMVLMAQEFSYRYPLVDGQGNWGSADDPKSFAAMRYTESRLSKFADLLLSELGQGTVDWQANFDGELEEPVILPARVPHVLLNSTTGIAVGMATDIPPHNLTEVINACIELLDNPKATLSNICHHIKGPDYPNGAEIITPKADILKLYETGRGSIRMRAIYQQDKNGDIIISALPYQASGAKILEQIGQQIQAKKLPWVSDLRDESDQEFPTRLVVVPKIKKSNVDELMLHLFACTDLEKSYRVNFNVIGLDGKPQVKPLVPLLQEWLTFRNQTLVRRLQFRLDKVLKRLHILDGLLIAFLNIDEIIEIIRTEDRPKAVLMERFSLSDRQAEAILELKLRHLAKLEEMKIKTEQDQLAKERDQLDKTLNSKTRLKNLLKKELKADNEAFGDPRRSTIVHREDARALSLTETIADDPVTVILSEKGWVRAAKGHDINPKELNYKSGDQYKTSIRTKSNQSLVFLDSTGRGYTSLAHHLPSARGQGEPLTGRFNVPSGAHFIGLLAKDIADHYFLASDQGYGFIAPINDLETKNRAGKAIVNITDAQLLEPLWVNNISHDWVALVSSEGRLLVFKADSLPVMAKGKGNKLMNLNDNEQLIASAILTKGQGLCVYAGQRKTKLQGKDLDHYKGERARRGVKLPRGFQKAQRIIAID